MIQLPFIVGISPTLKVRGIIATAPISKGTIIERCPVLILSETEEPHINKTLLGNYIFEWDDHHFCVALGYGSLMNHTINASVSFSADFSTKEMIFTAHRDIVSGEELTINYAGKPGDTDVDGYVLNYDITAYS